MVGYSYWGFLGDKKFNKDYEEVSTPDGNAFYSWSIISELQRRGKSVINLLPDRDSFGVISRGRKLFKAFAAEERANAYLSMKQDKKICNNKNSLKETIKKLEYVILEWRWEIPGRNDELTKTNNPDVWQPDLEMSREIIRICNENEIPLVVFDLDYKLTFEDIRNYKIKYVIELGDKWELCPFVKSAKVKSPFDFSVINEFELKERFENSLVYVGNRYERDWCIDKYIPEDLEDCMIYGNWKEGGRDSEERWKNLNFGNRVQTSDMYNVYSSSLATILLAKEEYCEKHFMTARIIEAVFYGCVPFFIEEYGNATIMEYAGACAEFLKVSSKEELKTKIEDLRNDVELRNNIIKYLRKHLRFMDCKFFIDDVEELLRG